MENPVIELFLALGIIIGAAKIAGSLSRYVGQPRVFGELLAGVILGPTLLNFLHLPVFHHSDQLAISIKELAELGVLLLMFNIGLDIHVRELVRVGRVALFGGSLGAIVPVAMVIPAVLAFNFSSEVALFAGIALAATSVSISAQTLLELNLLQTKEGYALLAMALVDDVLAILLISFGVATVGPGGGSADTGELALIVIRMAAYIVGAGLVAWYLLPPIFRALSLRPETSQAYGRAGFALIFALIFGWSAEFLGGVAPITGAFIAGVGVSRLTPFVKERIKESVMAISYVFLMPIFFVNVGLETDLKLIGLDALPFAGVLLLLAVVSKVIGTLIGGRLGGFDNGESFRVGVCMISRGEVGLIIAAIGLDVGVFTPEVFPSIFLVILLTTVLTPPLVRLAFRSQMRESAQPAAASASSTGS